MLPSATDTAAIEVVLKKYLAGFRDGDLASLQDIFATDSVHVLRHRELKEAVTITPIAQRLPGWSANADPQARLRNVRISFSGDHLGAAAFTLHYRGNVFDDQINLYRYDGGWRIGAKVTQVRPKQ